MEVPVALWYHRLGKYKIKRTEPVEHVDWFDGQTPRCLLLCPTTIQYILTKYCTVVYCTGFMLIHSYLQTSRPVLATPTQVLQ